MISASQISGIYVITPDIISMAISMIYSLIKFYDKHGDHFDNIEDDALNIIATVHRSSSLIETLNSRLSPYLDPRKGFKKERFELIKFALNHIPLMRSANEKMKGKSTAEIFA